MQSFVVFGSAAGVARSGSRLQVSQENSSVERQGPYVGCLALIPS